jgi:hypothetical protein
MVQRLSTIVFPGGANLPLWVGISKSIIIRALKGGIMISEVRSIIAIIITVLMFCAGPGASAQDRAIGDNPAVQKQIVTVRMSDGVDIALALYLPRGSGAVPALFVSLCFPSACGGKSISI